MPATQPLASVRELVPLLYVDDMQRSLAFYRDRLGFQVTEKWEPEAARLQWCRVEHGDAALMLQQACPEEDGPAANRGRGVVFYFLCDDADAIYSRMTAEGLHLDPPEVAFYGMKQLYLRDPDGYTLCFQNPVAG